MFQLFQSKKGSTKFADSAESIRETLRRLAFSFLGGLLLATAVFFYEGFLYRPDTLPFLHQLSDACTVSGLLLLCAGMFAFVLNGGGFDAFAYIGHRFRWSFSRQLRAEEPRLTPYHEFLQKRREKGKRSVGHLFAAGGVFLLVGILAAMLC